LKYGLLGQLEDHDAEAAQTRSDHLEAAADGGDAWSQHTSWTSNIAFSITGAPKKYFELLVEKSKDRCAPILQLPLLSGEGIPNSILSACDVQRTPYRVYATVSSNPVRHRAASRRALLQ
jgi:hypothetical protein